MPLNYHDLTTIYNGLTGKNVPTSETEAIQQTYQQTIQPVVEKTTVLVQQAKSDLAENLQSVISSTMEIAKKAVPTALAASASVQYLGGTPSFASFLQPWNLRSKYLLVAADRHTKIGWPCERFETLNTLSGFVMCEQVRLEIPGTANASGATLEEQQLIKQYLENGCFIE